MPIMNELCLLPKSCTSMFLSRGSGVDWVFGPVNAFAGSRPGQRDYDPDEPSQEVQYNMPGRWSVCGTAEQIVPLGCLFESGNSPVASIVRGVTLNLQRVSGLRPSRSDDFAPIVFFRSDYDLVPGVVFGSGQNYVDVVREVGDFRVSVQDVVDLPVTVGVDRRLLTMSFAEAKELASTECVVRVEDRW